MKVLKTCTMLTMHLLSMSGHGYLHQIKAWADMDTYIRSKHDQRNSTKETKIVSCCCWYDFNIFLFVLSTGMGVALYKVNKHGQLSGEQTSLLAQISAIVLSILLTRGGEYVTISHRYTVAFYTMGFVKYFLWPYIIIVYLDVYVPLAVDYLFRPRRIRRASWKYFYAAVYIKKAICSF